MASTNKTTNYELSQFVGSDKPAWLSDYNGDMSKIDTGIHNAQTTATGADGKADANTTNIGDLGYLSTTNKNNLVSAINEVDGNADTAQTTANNANINATSALNKVNGLETALNLSNISELTATINQGNISTNTMKIAKNSDGSICKVYGEISWDNTSSYSGSTTITLSGTGLSIDEPFVVSTAGIGTIYAGGINSTGSYALRYQSNGDIQINISPSSIVTRIHLMFMPFITFVKSFGDVDED